MSKINIQEIAGFGRWMVSGAFRDPSFYGFLTIILSAIMLYGACPAPWPQVFAITGVAVIAIDLFYTGIRFAYAVYRMQQNDLVRSLKQKN